MFTKNILNKTKMKDIHQIMLLMSEVKNIFLTNVGGKEHIFKVIVQSHFTTKLAGR